MVAIGNNVALVTGASRGIGIGSETARRLAVAGTQVAVHGFRNRARVECVAANIESMGRTATVVIGHVGKVCDATRTADDVAD